jgi:MFS transporter, DHA1 family, multidrug resistance protein
MKPIIVLLGLVMALPPLATDMYLVALPSLGEKWGESPTAMNMTLVFFFTTYCVFMLVYGPLSDRWGRRPPLLGGISIFIVASLGCAFSGNLTALLVARILQAVGAASGTSMALAICKDRFELNERVKVMAYMSVIFSLAPVIGPVLGAWIMTWLSWPWVFIFQAIIGTALLVGVMVMKESNRYLEMVSPIQIMNGYLRLVKNRLFIGNCLLLALTYVPIYAYIASAAYIYIDKFGTSKQVFGYIFSTSAIALMLGSWTTSFLTRVLSINRLMTIGFLGQLLSSLGLLIFVPDSILGFALLVASLFFWYGTTRPNCNTIILELVSRDIGAASSMIAFSFMMMASGAMAIASFDMGDKVALIGYMGTISGFIFLSGWIIVSSYSRTKLEKKWGQARN